MSLVGSETHTRLATARPGSGLRQNPKGPTRVPPCHPCIGALPPLREPVCRREEANAETASNGVGGNLITLLSTWIQPHLTPPHFSQCPE